MKILVTGGAGFIGSNITDAYISAGHKVTVLDNLSSGNKNNINPKASFFEADITDNKKVREIFEAGKFDAVNHHAAQIDVRKSVSDPVFDATVNIIGTINLLESCKNTGVGRFIFASSGGTIYGECGGNPPDENAKGMPLSPYGIAKYSVESYLKYYSELFGLTVVPLRYGNVYGPRQDPHGEAGVVAIFSERMLNNSELVIFGDGEQMRDYVYVGDVVRANIAALERGGNETINIGTCKTTSVLELFNQMARITGYKKKPVFQPKRAGELFKSILDNRKAGRVLGWSPEVTIESGLKNTIEYFKNGKR